MKKITIFFINLIINIFFTNSLKNKLLALMKPETDNIVILKILSNIYYSYWIKNVYLKIDDPNQRNFYQKLCLTGLSPNLDWPLSENAPMTDIKSKFILKKIDDIISRKIDKNKKLMIIQLGSSSGRFIKKISHEYSYAKCVGIDYIKEYVDYSNLKNKNNNLNYIHKSGHEIDDILKLNLGMSIIIFSIGSSSYFQPEHIKEMFFKISKFQGAHFVLAENYYKNNFNSDYQLKSKNFERFSVFNGGMHYSHKYDEYAKMCRLQIKHREFSEKNNAIMCNFLS